MVQDGQLNRKSWMVEDQASLCERLQAFK